MAYNGRKRHELFHALRATPLFANASSITIIISANYPENVLKFHSYVFALTALTIPAKSAIELQWWEWVHGTRHPVR